MEVLQEFKKFGWKVKTSGGEKIASKQDGDNLVEVVVQQFYLPNSVKLELSVSASSKEFCGICAKVAGRKEMHATICQTYLEKPFADLSKIDIKSLSDEIEIWWGAQPIASSLKTMSQPPPETGQAQLYHLAALAYLGDFNTLMEYQSVFSKGKRMGFVPMIKAEMIERALDIALERA